MVIVLDSYHMARETDDRSTTKGYPHMRYGDVWIIVPTYNEASVVRSVLEQLLTRFPNVVAVDDCSTDSSAAEIRASGARIVRHPINMGAGGALQTGIDFALLDDDARYFVTFDADGQHRVEDAVAMIDHMRDSSVDVLLGSRFLGDAVNMGRTRRLLLIAARWFERLSTGLTLTDAHNGLRVFNRRFAEALNLRMTDMAWATEFLTRAVEIKAVVEEFPVTIEYSDYSLSKGQHSINSINIGIDILLNRFLRGPH
ncbi:MAG: glycosyltransferase family 2 protein [Microlunatus sp.]